MKRARSILGHPQPPGAFDVWEDIEPLVVEKEITPRVVSKHTEILLIPGQEDNRPNKFRKQGSRLVSALRSLTNSGVYHDPAMSGSPLHDAQSNFSGLGQKISAAMMIGQFEPTIVHRTKFKSRPSFPPSNDKDMADGSPDVSPSNSGNELSSGKSSIPRENDSTGVTSLNSKSSANSKVTAQYTSELKKQAVGKAVEGGSNEQQLTSIAEVDQLEEQEPVPTVITVEQASAAKVFFECYYNELTSGQATPRSLRRRQLEGVLYQDTNLTSAEKDERRIFWARTESDHLREVRDLKNRGSKAMKGNSSPAANYEVVKILGKGSFGVVRLVREKDDQSAPAGHQKEIFAMKVIRKSEMLRNSQEGHLRAERDFLVSAEGSRWVVPLIASFQDMQNLYLVMDYMPGGDFLGLLIRDNVLSEATTKWYVAEMILCIEEAHSLHWIHRDVKPDNFLISASGHLKISDFGLAFDGHWSHDQAFFNNHRYSLLAKLGIQIEGDAQDKEEERSRIANAVSKAAHSIMGIRDRHERNSSNPDGETILNWRNRWGNRSLARSVVGTSQYMAPEVVRGEHYDARCDWWSVAVILYECLYGHTPFLAEEGGRQQTKLNIISHDKTFGFPSKPNVSKRCQDLMRLIITNKTNRLCSKRYRTPDVASSSPHTDYAGRYVYPNDAEDIKAHKWFRDIPWDRMHMMVPPFVPAITSLEDTHYFDEEEPISDFPESATGPAPTVAEIADALKPFNREIQIMATEFIEKPHDTVRLKKAEKDIDALATIRSEQKEYLKAFVKHYGRKEKKRPRDKLLRDRETAPKVLEMRKKGAFLGYTYRRYRPTRETYGRPSTGSRRSGIVASGSAAKRTVWHRARLSIH